MEGLGGLLVKVGIDHSGVAEGKAKVEGLLSSMGSSGVPGIQKIGGMLQGLPTPALAAAGAIAGIGIAAIGVGKAGIEEFTKVGKEVLGLQRRVGGTAEEMSKLRFIAEETGTSTETLGKSMGILSKHLSANDAAAKELGFSYRDANGQAMPLDQVLIKLSDKFKGMPNGIDKNALALKLFGKAGLDMLPMLNRGSEALKELASEAEKYGLVLTGKNLDAVKESIKQQRELHAIISGIKVQIGSELLPEVNKFGAALNGFLIPAIKGTKEALRVLEDVGKFFKPMVESRTEMMKQGAKDAESTTSFLEGLMGKHKKVSSEVTFSLLKDEAQQQAASQETAQAEAASAKEREAALSEIGKFAGEAAAAQAAASGKTIEALKEEAEEAKRQAGERKKGLQEVADAAGASARDQVASSKLTGDEIAGLGAEVKKTHDAIKSSFESASSVVGKFGSATQVSATEIKKFFQDTKDSAESWRKDIKTLMASGIDQGIIEEVAQAGPKAEPLVRGMLDLVKSGGVTAVNSLYSSTKTIEADTIQSLTNMQVSARVGGVGIGKAATEGVHDGATILNAWSKSIGGIFKDMGDDAVGKMNSTKGDAHGAGIGIGASTAEGAQSGLSGLPGHFTAAGQAGISATHEQRGEARGAAYGIGAEMGSGMQAGLGGTVQGMRNIMRWYVQEAIAAGKAAAGIASPSKLFRDQMGKPIGLGVAEGIKDSKGYVEDALAMLTQAQGGSLMRGMRSGVLPTSSPISKPTSAANAGITIQNMNVTSQRPDDIATPLSRELGWLSAGKARGRA